MTEQQEESKRISIQVTSLSTQLIESIDKQSRLEEQLNQAKKALALQREAIDQHNSLKQELQEIKKTLSERDEELANTKKQHAEADKARLAAEYSVERLNKEIEDLTTSLFNEANGMVVEARKEQHAVEVLNSKLQEQLREKDALLETLTIQLKNLKEVLYKVEDEQNTLNNYRQSMMVESTNGSNVSLEGQGTNPPSVYDIPQLNILFSPVAQSLRYDIPMYTEYLRFLAVLPLCKSIKDTKHDSKFLKKLITEEIQPILRLDAATGLGWLVRRNLMNLMLEGLVVVEPISGINETYRKGYATPQSNTHRFDESETAKMFSYPINSPPVAIEAPCAFCAESRNDILEHGRLYVLKTLLKAEDGTTSTDSQYPLCHYCLLKIRQICAIFAFLRSLKAGAWNLENVTLSCAKEESEEFTQVSQINGDTVTMSREGNFSAKRLSFMSNFSRNSVSSKVTPKIEAVSDFSERKGLPSTNVQRSWLHLVKLRASLHWSHIGVWTLEDAFQLKVVPMNSQDQGGSLASRSPVPPHWVNISSPTSIDNSFIFQKEDEVEEEGFDFEQGEETIETIKPVNKDGIEKNLQNERSLNDKEVFTATSEPNAAYNSLDDGTDPTTENNEDTTTAKTSPVEQQVSITNSEDRNTKTVNDSPSSVDTTVDNLSFDAESKELSDQVSVDSQDTGTSQVSSAKASLTADDVLADLTELHTQDTEGSQISSYHEAAEAPLAPDRALET